MALTRSQVQISNDVVSNFLATYINEESAYVAPRVMPSTRVDHDFIEYVKLDKTNRKAYETLSSAYAAPEVMDFSFTTGTATLQLHDFAIEIPKAVLATSKVPGFGNEAQAEQLAAKMLADVHMRRRERAFAATISTQANWGANTAVPGVLWNTTVNGNFINDINVQANNILRATGRRPNTLIVNPNVFQAMVENTSFKNRNLIQGTNVTTEDAMRQVIGNHISMNVIIAKSGEDTAVLGAAASNNWLFGDHAWIVYVDQFGLYQPTFGFNAYGDLPEIRSNDLSVNSDSMRRVVKIAAYQKYVDVYADYDLGYFFRNVLA